MPRKSRLSPWQLLLAVGFLLVIVIVLYRVFSTPPVHRSTIAACLSNEKQLALAMMQYMQDNDQHLPSGLHAQGIGWAGQIYPYVKNADCFRCPDDSTASSAPAAVVSYGYNVNLAHSPAWKRYPAPAATVLFFEVTGVSADVTKLDEGASQGRVVFSAAGNGTEGMLMAGNVTANYATGNLANRPEAEPSEFLPARHRGRSNFTFADGHVKWLKPSQISTGHDAASAVAGQTGGVEGDAAGTQAQDAQGNSAFVGKFSTR